MEGKANSKSKEEKEKLEEKGWETGNSISFITWVGAANDKQKFLQEYHSHLLQVVDYMESLIPDPIEMAQIRYGADLSVERITSLEPDKVGSVFKLGGLDNRRWQKRWCILLDDLLFYYNSATSTSPKGLIKLNRITEQPAHAENDEANAQGGLFCFWIPSPDQKRTFVLATSSHIEGQEWIESINAATLSSPRKVRNRGSKKDSKSKN